MSETCEHGASAAQLCRFVTDRLGEQRTFDQADVERASVELVRQRFTTRGIGLDKMNPVDLDIVRPMVLAVLGAVGTVES